MKFWQWLRQCRSLRFFVNLLTDRREPDNHSQLTLFLMLIIAISIFFLILHAVFSNNALTNLNAPLYYFLSSLRGPVFDKIMLPFTFFGEAVDLFIISAIFFIWLLKKRYWYVAVHWMAITVLSFATTIECKVLIFSPRPEPMASILNTSSFPSAHTTLTLALIGFFAVIIARELPTLKRRIPYTIATIMVLLVGFSRLYLGAHWLTDVVGGIILGLALVLLVTISYRRRHTCALEIKSLVTAILTISCCVWFAYSMVFFHHKNKIYAPVWPEQVITVDSWKTSIDKLPLYRLNRLGHPIEAFNVEWLGDLTSIKESLLKQGWEVQPTKLDLQGMIRSFSSNSITYHLPLFPQLYHSRRMELLLTKRTNESDAVLILRLWQSDIKITNTAQILWVGSIEYHHAAQKIFSLHGLKNKSTFIGATDYLTKYLKDFKWQLVNVPLAKQPQEMRELSWNGKMILIR